MCICSRVAGGRERWCACSIYIGYVVKKNNELRTFRINHSCINSNISGPLVQGHNEANRRRADPHGKCGKHVQAEHRPSVQP